MLKPLVLTALLAAGLATPALAAPKHPQTPLQMYERMCANVLNTLPRIVSKQAVLALPSDVEVSVHYICTGVDLNDFGNVVGLGHSIAQNHALARALARRGLTVDDVVGIEIAGDTVQLYVHRA